MTTVVHESKVAQRSTDVIESIMNYIVIEKAHVREEPENINLKAVEVFELHMDSTLKKLLKSLSSNRGSQLSAIREAIRLAKNLDYLPAASLSK